MRYTAITLAFFAIAANAQAQEKTIVRSPDKKLEIQLSVEAGKPGYAVFYSGQAVLEPSPLGLKSSVGDFTEGLQQAGAKTARVKDSYQLNRSKVSQVNYKANELTWLLRNAAGDTVQVVFQVSNDNIAFCYRLPAVNGKTGTCVIEKELTGFDFPASTTTFITPQALPMTGWKKTKPSYEEFYTVEEPAGTVSKDKAGYTFPALFHVQKKAWVLISETGIAGNYPGTHLSEPVTGGLYTIAFPQSGENNGEGATTASAVLPVQTSWKTITVGQTLKPVIESTISTDVVKPLIQSEKVFAPGRASWSWIVWQDSSCNYNDQVTFIDLAAKLKCEYILIDALWDVQIGRDKMAELVRYATSKGVSILLWYNSNGTANEAPQTPKDKMHIPEVRRQEMAWLQQIGVKGLKIDFFGGDKQVTMQLYHDILVDAALYGLCINFHGATLPRGWERMYPNYMTSEAVLASENLVFQQSFCDKYAQLATIYPFTRNAVAAMDFGPVFLQKKLSRFQKGGNTRRTTDAFEIATSVLFFSAVQHWGLTPANLDAPAFLIDFVKDVPATWDEIRFIDGFPGQYCVLARRKGKKWYVAAVNGENKERNLTLHLPMFKNKTISVIRDGQGTEAVNEAQKPDSEGKFTIRLNGNGGAVLFN
ncbi:hypothetical protein HNQ91_001509 [Filimonas zeae]|uniref:Alpha-glucosidase n=1 Tax=Filimonas zeae TaxID=1737353 RepID=A0A917MW99_9BACT|nr:glycoside hydrolase family 97 protein [Filimonas zeae]MDR6338458.1 hypothetical protein [Filimonas zeae]GGH68166.1 alpha-glucosidase [Filimonas zeae]